MFDLKFTLSDGTSFLLEILSWLKKCYIQTCLLFNIHINDTFFALNEIDICNFADDKNLKSLLKRYNTILS